MGFAFKGVLAGMKPALAKLAVVKDAARKRILRKALPKASQPMTKTAKSLAPEESKLYKKSIGRKVKTYRSGIVVVLIGARTGRKMKVKIKADRVYRMIHGRRVRLKNPGAEYMEVLRNPTKYSHLIEFGTAGSAAKPHLRPAFQQHKAQFVQDASRIILEEIAREAAKR